MAQITSLQTLLTPQTSQQIFDALIAIYQQTGFPTSAWAIGGTERTRLAAFSTAAADLISNNIPILAASGFVDFAQNLPGQWMAFLAQEMYNLIQIPATFLQGNITLTNTTSSSITISSGNAGVVFPLSGNRYFNTTNGTLSANSTLTLLYQSEFAQNTSIGLNYNQDGTNSAITLLNPIPGVTVSNPGYAFNNGVVSGHAIESGVLSSGVINVSPGTIVSSGGDSASDSVVIDVTTAGNITNNTAIFSYNLNSGAHTGTLSYVSTSQTVTIPIPFTTGFNITLSDNNFDVSITPNTFILNDKFFCASSQCTTPVPSIQTIGDFAVSGNAGGDFHAITVECVIAGNIFEGTAQFTYSIDNALPVQFGASIAYPNNLEIELQVGEFLIPGTNIMLWFSDNGQSMASSTFYVGNSFTFQTPGNWVTQQGVNIETNTALTQRCKNQWNTLSQVPTQGFYQYIISSASTLQFPNLGAQATQIIVNTNAFINNKVDIIVAGPAGPLSTESINALQQVVDAYAPITDYVVINNPLVDSASPYATITYSLSLNSPPLNVIQTNVNDAVVTYLESVPINGLIIFSQLIQTIMNVTGVLNVQNMSIIIAGITYNSDINLSSIAGAGQYLLVTIVISNIFFSYTTSLN